MDAGAGQVGLGVAARRVADARKALVTMFSDAERGVTMALDLMNVPPGAATQEQRSFAPIIASAHAQSLRDATLIVADADMSALVDTASPSMPDQRLRVDDPIYRHGLVLWARPLADRTGQPPLLPVHLLSWTHVPADSPILAGQAGESVLITSYVAGSDIAELLGAQLRPNAPKYVPNATVMWTVGTEIGAAYGRTPDVSGVAPGFYQRVLAAFWTVAKQPLAEDVAAERPLPQDRKRYARAGITHPGDPVRLVRLRQRPRRAEEAGEPTGRTVGVRYVVSPYWRNTYYPSLAEHRQQLVAGSVRGPQDAPLQGGEKVLIASARDLRPAGPATP